jgi:hypothetical protein
MNAPDDVEKEKILTILRMASELRDSNITAVSNFALHVLAESRTILDQLMIIIPAKDRN